METGRMETGRKYWVTMTFLALTTLAMVGSYLLALAGKLSAEWVQLVTIYFSTAAALAGVFHATNAYISGSPAQRRDQPSSVTVQAPRAESVTATATTVQGTPPEVATPRDG